MEKILITPRSFGKADPAPFSRIEEAGYEIVRNPAGKIMTEEQMCEAVRDVAGVIIGVDPLNETVLSCAQNLRAIAKYGVGVDNIALEAAKARGIPVSITAGANSNAVADYAFALMMACARKLPRINEMCHEKNWTKVVTQDVYGKTLGILGLGAIGKGVARRAKGFDMKVLAYDIFWDEEYAKANGIARASLDEIYAQCDFISLHMPLTDETRHMIGREQFASMKNTAILVNTARGGLIDEGALIEALQSGAIYGAGIDVFEQEPPANEALYAIENLIMGSHCAAASVGAAENMSMLAAENILRDLSKS